MRTPQPKKADILQLLLPCGARYSRQYGARGKPLEKRLGRIASVLSYAGRGYVRQEIAARLNVSRNTVNNDYREGLWMLASPEVREQALALFVTGTFMRERLLGAIATWYADKEVREAWKNERHRRNQEPPHDAEAIIRQVVQEHGTEWHKEAIEHSEEIETFVKAAIDHATDVEPDEDGVGWCASCNAYTKFEDNGTCNLPYCAGHERCSVCGTEPAVSPTPQQQEQADGTAG